MARIRIQDENREITDPQEMSLFLKPFGIGYEKWDVEGRVDSNATSEVILNTYAKEIEILKKRGGFVEADVIDVSPQTPGLDALLDKFKKEHTHAEDEIRFTVRGSGLFHIHPLKGPIFALQVETGDLINVPAGTQHWFDLCSDRMIRCIRLFQDRSGWTPHYIDDPVHERYTPVCMGPQYIPSLQSSL